MLDKLVRSRIDVETLIDSLGQEWLQFYLSASQQKDLWRPDAGLQEQVELEALEIRQQLLSRISCLSNSTDEIRLNPSRFWEIFSGGELDSAELEVVLAAKDLAIKRLHIDGGDGDLFSLHLEGFPNNFTRLDPIELNIVIKSVSSHRATCRIAGVFSSLSTNRRKELRLIWIGSTHSQVIAQRLLKANRDRRPIRVNAHLVKDLAGRVHSLEFASFSSGQRPAVEPKRSPTDWFSRSEWPMPIAAVQKE